MAWSGWRVATEQALYGERGFYRSAEGPAAHFRTAAHASPLLAEVVLALARDCGLDHVVDVGAGRGELLTALHALDPGLALTGVDVVPRPSSLPAAAQWAGDVPREVDGLLIGHEWLDNVPVDVAASTDDGWRLVEVDSATGAEQTAGAPDADDLAWLDRWWPDPGAGARAEIGRPRDEAWAAAVSRLRRGVAVAVDYAHTVDTRPREGSLAAYRDGVRVDPVPDGTCDITSHVALDACAVAGAQAGSHWTRLLAQRDVVTALVARPSRPDHDDARRDPPGYLAALSRSGQYAELTAASGWGSFCWLLQGFGVERPSTLGATSDVH